MSFKIPCGGFELDEKSFSLDENDVLSLSVGAQSDWNQNDETALGYVKNRPFYTGDSVETVLLEETTAPFEDVGGGTYLTLLQSTNILSVGETYTVSWDGILYESACVDADGIYVIGNQSIMGASSDTGEPFIILQADVDPIQIITLNTSASHTVSISRLGAPEVVKIDEKYLPTIPAPIYIIKNDSTFSSSMTFEEAWKLPPNILASRLNFAVDASSVEGGVGSSCREVGKSNIRNLGENIVATFSVLSASSDNTYTTTNYSIIWTKNGITALTPKDGV